MLLALGVRERAEDFAHAPGAHHAFGQLGGLLDIVGRAGADAGKDDLFGRSPPEGHRQFAFELVLVLEIALFGQKPGHPCGAAPGNDGDLVDRVRVGEEARHQGMAGFVKGRGALVLLAHDLAFALQAHEDLVLGVLEVDHVDPFLVTLGCQQGRLVDQVFQVGPGKARRSLCQALDAHILVDGRFFHVDLQDLFAPPDVRQRDHHLPVEAPRPQQGRVEDVRPVGG